MDALAEVEIDREGKFKYILVKIWLDNGKEGEEEAKLIVRGTSEAEFHPDIMAKVKRELSFKLKRCLRSNFESALCH